MKANGGKYVTTKEEKKFFAKMVFALIILTILGKACGLDKEKKNTGFVDNNPIVVAVEMNDSQF